ncbi:hypothetical protein, partial [Escherichia coli]
RNGGKNSLNRLIRCVCGKKIGPDPRNFNQRVSLGRNDLLIRTFPSMKSLTGFQILQTAQILFYPTLALINLVIAIDLRYRCRSSSSFCIDNSIF